MKTAQEYAEGAAKDLVTDPDSDPRVKILDLQQGIDRKNAEIILQTIPLEALVKCAEALKEVVRISDRKHDAWDKAKEALAELERKDAK